ncbi:anti-sigma-I factor RsgI family protein [Oceanobacillus saliphilus]|uniref:anti-sigma-I factor RsgI family protein n=1 Tax=Oceanobacillus saliphilus TaxID=2925834 RepID=UPI00201D6F52|nr:hypothetical protein [Oceanobacillus saliphilus]
MKRGIVLERHSEYTIMMTKDGLFEKAVVLGENATVGEEVSYEPLMKEKKKTAMLFPLKRSNMPLKALSMACIVLLLVLPIYFLTGKNETYAYVTVDINPSIEMEVDKDFNVQHVRALNEDASALVKDLTDIENETIQNVIGIIINKSELFGLINDEKNMIVGISFVEESHEEIRPVPKNLESYFSDMSDWEIATLIVPTNIREQAKEIDTSMNEVMASKILAEEIGSSLGNSLDSNDKAIINSFYNNENEEDDNNSSELNDVEKFNITPVVKDTDEKPQSETDVSKSNADNDKKNKDVHHPSELKNKNSENNSNGKTSGDNEGKDKQNKGSNPNNVSKENKNVTNEKAKDKPAKSKQNNGNNKPDENNQQNSNAHKNNDNSLNKDNNRGNNENRGNGNDQDRGKNNGNGNANK